MDGIQFVLFIWPLAILSALLLVVLSIVSFTRKKPSGGLAMFCILAAVVVTAFNLVVVVSMSGRMLDLGLASFAPVALLGILCVVGGVRLSRKGTTNA